MNEMNEKSIFTQFVNRRVVVFNTTTKGTMRHQGVVKGVDEKHLYLYDEISKNEKLILLDSINLCEILRGD